MDIRSVFKADRDLVERSAALRANNDLKRALDAPSAESTPTSAASLSANSLVQTHPADDRNTASSAPQVVEPDDIKEPVWKKESCVAQVSIRNSFINEESELAQELRQQNEREKAQAQEERRQEAMENAKEVIASLNQKRLAIRFDTAEKFDNANVVNIVDSETSEVLRQIPSEEILRVRAAVQAYEQRLAHDDMMTDPSLKAKGVDTAGVNEDLRGVVIDFEA